MTIPRPRLTVRRLMIVVALAGVALGVLDLMARRRAYALDKAGQYQVLSIARSFKFDPIGVSSSKTDPMGDRMVGFYGQMAEKWQAAAARPWLPFETDPPPPK